MTAYQLPTKLASEIKEINATREAKKRRQVAGPRTFVKEGEYKGVVLRPRRADCGDLENAPSLFCKTRHYPDGRREKVED